MKGIYDYSDKECSENGENKSNNNDEKNKIIRKYMSIVEDGMKNDSENVFDNYELNSNDSINQTGGSNYPDSNDDIILSDDDIKNSILGNSDWETRTYDNNCDNVHNNSDIDKLNESSIINKSLSDKDTNNIDQIDKSDRNDICSDSEMINDIILEKDGNNEKNKEDISLSEYISTQTNEEESIQGTKETINKTNDLQLDIDNLMEFNNESTNFQSCIKESVYNLESIEDNEKKNSCFFMEIKDLNEWKEKHRYLTSSFRRMEKKLNKIINSENINLGTRRSLKQHKDFLDNEYKEVVKYLKPFVKYMNFYLTTNTIWLCVLQKIVSEYKKNIGAQVSELNEKEYFILSKNIYEDFKGNHLEELNISNVLFLLITKHQIQIDDDIVDYLEQCYETINKDKTLNNIIQKVNEINKNIEDIGGETGSWDSDQNNYFMEVYENNIHLGDEIICGILKNGLNKNENEILEHIEWYRKFVSRNTLRNKWLNSINIINTNDQKKSNLKIQEKKQMIQLWKDKKSKEQKNNHYKRYMFYQKIFYLISLLTFLTILIYLNCCNTEHESEIKNKEVQQMKKDELKIQRKIRDDIKKKKELLQNELNKKKEDMKKNKIEKRQKSILSEEMLQRINERNERILQKKVQSNVNLNDDNNEKNKKQSNQKYMHVQSKLLSNTGTVN
ncbi:coiled-coil domain-containing protein CCDC148/CCDC112 [Plasmodium yoelii yoelii]|uniref:Coiled-coil domain-containing protein CCDC148/CCDC112 n=2 Tax=Plasmodium yoelii yoelii TaxID=73239 RepID=A0AAE9WQH0_PLAYO|nr:coiled-coil domain-containing protein CCDC148/CCDC112 [Plasmodium yoelii yoelii]